MRLVQWFNKGLCTVASPGEVLGAAVVLGIVFIFIVPLPTWLVDVLIALNICIASLLIVLAFYLPSPLAFSSFPALLLLTTMFRLALSIATSLYGNRPGRRFPAPGAAGVTADRLADPLCPRAAGNRPGRGRTLGARRVAALGLQHAAAPGGACRPDSRGGYHRDLYRTDRAGLDGRSACR